MFSKKNIPEQESVAERRNRIMAQIFEQMLRRKESLEALSESKEQRDDWSKRLKLVEIKMERSPNSKTLQFLHAQALLNHQIAEETFQDKYNHHQKMIELTDGATEALESLERIALAEATREALQNHRNAKLISGEVGSAAGIPESSIRELNRAEQYVKALTEITLEDSK